MEKKAQDKTTSLVSSSPSTNDIKKDRLNIDPESRMKDNAASEYITVNFIPEEESEFDAFGIHTETAEALCQIIKKNENTSIRSIGLLGYWGSGKSTVVKLAKKRLEKEKSKEDKEKYFFFTFDAWLNQGDDPRKAFLESLLEAAKAKKHLKDKDYKKEKNDIQGGRVENTEHTISYFTYWGAIASTALLFIPLASRLFKWEEFFFSPRNLTALGITLIPLILSILYRLSLFFKSKKDNITGVPNIFSGTASGTEKKITFTSSTATSIQFNAIYKSILSKFTPKDLKTLIVFDNLDRVEKQAAITMWTMVRSLLISKKISQFSNEKENENTITPFILIPLDKKSIEHLYDSDNAECRHRAESFSDKTFDVVLELRPPIFSDWAEYLRTQIEYVFGKDKVDLNEFIIIKKLFDTAQEKADHYLHSITPRKINSILNKVAAEYSLWGTKFSYPILFYYIIFKESITESFPSIKGILGVKVIESYDKKWLESIAALYYGVDKEKALQTYMDTAIVECIKNKNKELFARVSSSSVFSHIFEKTINQSEFIRSDASYILRCALYINDSHVTLDDVERKFVLKQIYPTFRSIKSWTFDEEDIQGVRYFLDHNICNPKDIFNLFITSCKNSDRPEEAAKKFSSLLNILEQEEKKELIDSITFSTSADYFISMLTSLGSELIKNNKKLINSIKVGRPHGEVLEAFLASLANQNSYDKNSLDVLCTLRDMKNFTEANWNPIFVKIEEFIEKNVNEDSTPSIIWGIKALLNICFKDNGKAKNLASSNILRRLYNQIKVQKHPEKEEALNYLIILLLLYNPEEAEYLISNYIADSDFPKSFAPIADEIIKSTGHHAKIFNQLALSAYNQSSYSSIVKELIYYKINNFGNLGIVYTNLYSDYLHILFSFIDDDSIKRKIILYLSDQNYFYERFHLIKNDSAVYYIAKSIAGHKNQARIYEAFFDYIAQKNEDWWKNAFSSAREEMFPVNWLAKNQVEFPNKKFNDEFYHQLNEHRDSLIDDSDDKSIPLVKKEWGNLLEFADEDKKKVFLENVRDTIFTNGTTLEEANLLSSLFITKLKELDSFTNSYDKYTRKILDILNSDDIEIKDMHAVQDSIEYIEIIDAAEKSTKKVLREKLISLYEESKDEEEKTSLEETIKKWKFRLPTKKKGVNPPENEEK